MTNTVPVWFAGKILDNWTEVVLVNNALKTQNITVPANSYWMLYGGKYDNADDVARDCSAKLYNENDKLILELDYKAGMLASAIRNFPTREVDVMAKSFPIPMKPGWYVQFHFAAGGVSAGGTSEVILLVREIVA